MAWLAAPEINNGTDEPLSMAGLTAWSTWAKSPPNPVFPDMMIDLQDTLGAGEGGGGSDETHGYPISG